MCITGRLIFLLFNQTSQNLVENFEFVFHFFPAATPGDPVGFVFIFKLNVISHISGIVELEIAEAEYLVIFKQLADLIAFDFWQGGKFGFLVFPAE